MKLKELVTEMTLPSKIKRAFYNIVHGLQPEEVIKNIKKLPDDYIKLLYELGDKAPAIKGTPKDIAQRTIEREYKKRFPENISESKKNKSPLKARNKALNDALMATKSGGHYSEKSDYKRAKEKAKLRKQLQRGDE